ncbi:50S ribosomal protein L17, partial [Helicobacter pylori]
KIQRTTFRRGDASTLATIEFV